MIRFRPPAPGPIPAVRAPAVTSRRALRVLGLVAACGAAACGDRGAPTSPGPVGAAGDTLLSGARIGTLPAGQRPPWLAYLDSSGADAARDRAAVDAEVRAAGLPAWTPAPVGPDFYLTSDMTDSWFHGAEARRIADDIVSFQTPTGGWSKAVDVRTRPRAPSESYASGANWTWISTFDNGATTEHLRFLGAAARAQGDARHVASFMAGLGYVARAQFPNGCWPQVYPLEGSYHDAATFNDGVMVRILELLDAVARGEYPFVPAAARTAAAASSARGLACTLAAQVVVAGRRTVWAQQHDPLTLAPVKGRAYEPVALYGLESAGVMDYLMALAAPAAAAVAAVQAAASWFRANAIYGYIYDNVDLLPRAGAGPLWARFYEIGSGRPIFGDRDGSVHYQLGGISEERRLGYAWYTTAPLGTLQRYDSWALQRPAAARHPTSRIWTTRPNAGY
jgi:PelA/Pel-15E family pectate lyase